MIVMPGAPGLAALRDLGVATSAASVMGIAHHSCGYPVLRAGEGRVDDLHNGRCRTDKSAPAASPPTPSTSSRQALAKNARMGHPPWEWCNAKMGHPPA